MKSPPDDRNVVARAAQWTSRIMTVSLEMVLPGLAGLWVDRQLGTVAVFTLVGFALGSAGAVWHLLAMTRQDMLRRNASRPNTTQPESSSHTPAARPPEQDRDRQ